jgi:hypothetical protein
LDADELAPAASTLIVRETTLVSDSVNSNASKSALRAAICPEALSIGLFLPFLGTAAALNRKIIRRLRSAFRRQDAEQAECRG